MSSKNNDSSSRKGLIRAVVLNLWATGGVKSFYRGLGAGVVGVFPYAAIDLSTFEGLWRMPLFSPTRTHLTTVLKASMLKRRGKSESSALTLLICGSLSGSIGAISVYPLNLVRTRPVVSHYQSSVLICHRLQASGTAAHPQVYNGFADVVRQTYREGGVRGFYRGLTVNSFFFDCG